MDVDTRPVCHGQEAVEVGLVQEDVDSYASQRGRDHLLEDVHVCEDVHGDGNHLQAHGQNI